MTFLISVVAKAHSVISNSLQFSVISFNEKKPVVYKQTSKKSLSGDNHFSIKT